MTTSTPVDTAPTDVEGYLVTRESLHDPVWQASDTTHKSLEPVSERETE